MMEQEFLQYTAYAAQHFGIRLGPEKRALVEARLYKMCRDCASPECRNPGDFLAYLQQDKSGRARELLANALTTNHTFFMRETDHFSCFMEQVLPYWADKIQDGDVRTWCAACSTGEEAYTLAMLLQDFFSVRTGVWDYTLLATDLSQRALEKARMGVYMKESVESLPRHWQLAYFRSSASKEEQQIVDRLRRQVIFRPFNLMQPFPFRKRFHAIFCRNAMIYFDADTRRQLARKFYDFLEPGGFLFVGHSEVVDRMSAPFSYVMPSVYQRV